MGLQVKRKTITSGEVKYKIWNTVSGGYHNRKWWSKDEVVQHLFWRKIRRFISEFLEDAMTFPHGYYDKDLSECIMDNEEARREYFKVLKDGIDDESILFKRFLKELGDIDIQIKVVNGEYNFGSLLPVNEWIPVTEESIKQLEESKTYMCFVPDCKHYQKHYAEYHFDGEKFRDRQAMFGLDRIVEASHYMIITNPE